MRDFRFQISDFRFSIGCRLAFLTSTILVTPVLAADWTQFRGPGGSAVSAERNLPAEWSKTQNIRWKAELPGRGLSNPVTSGGRIFVTACSGYQERRLHVLGFDARSGKKLWERQFTATGSTNCHPKTSMAAPTPATDGERVFALFATGDLGCFDFDGNLIWYRGLVPDYPQITNQVGMSSSPIVHKDVLILPMDNSGESFVAGIDARTGQNRWKIERKREINWATPFIFEHGGQAHLLWHHPGEIAAYDPQTGKSRWTFEDTGLGNIPSFAAGGGLLLAPSSGVTAFKVNADGKPQEAAWREVKLRSSYASPLYYDGKVYGITPTPAVTCVDAKDGKVLWQQRLKGHYWASPVAADGKIYVASEEGVTTVLAAGPEAKILAENNLEDTFLATPAIADGCIYLRSDKHLYCIAKK